MTKTKTKIEQKDKKEKGSFLQILQKIGKSLVFPIAVLPAAAIFLRVGVAISDAGAVDGNTWEQIVYWIGWVMSTPADVIFGNLPLIFGVGVAFGFAKDNRGEAALVGVLIYLGIVAMAEVEGSFSSLIYGNVLTTTGTDGKEFSEILYLVVEVDGAFYETWLLSLGVFGGIGAGLLAATLYNKYSEVRLPAALGFFSGRRFVPMVSLLATAVIGMLIAVVWPWAQYGLVKMSEALVKVPELGAGAYAFANRLLIPFGLHQVLNTFFWFQMPITFEGSYVFIETTAGVFEPLFGDITAFLASNSSVKIQVGAETFIGAEAHDILSQANVGTFQTGYFPIMMFGLPAVALAIAKNADKSQRKTTFTFLLSAAAVSFLTGITEPLEFSFMFISPILYFGYALLSGVVASLTVLTGASFGFGFSAGAIDLFLSLQNSVNLAKGSAAALGGYMGLIWILIIGFAVMPVYYLMTDVIIRITNAPTQGRTAHDSEKFNRPKILDIVAGTFKIQPDAFELGIAPKGVKPFEAENTEVSSPTSKTSSKTTSSKTKKGKKDFTKMAEDTIKLVGKTNILEVENCITRVRLTLKDNSKITNEMVKKIGYVGATFPGKKSAQFIIGPDSEIIANKIKQILNKK